MAFNVRRIRARLPTYLAYIRERPKWLFTLILGRLVAMRRLERLINPIDFGVRFSASTSKIVAPDPAQLLSELDRDGIASGLQLAPRDVAAIRRFAETRQCLTRDADPLAFFPADIDSANKSRPRDIIAAHYHEQVQQCPEITALENDPWIAGIADAYIGHRAHHIRTRLWWSFPGTRVEEEDLHAAAQNKLHFDINDWRTVKFFFYITDVDRGSGPHIYIEGSHRARKLSHQFSLMVGHDTEDLLEYYGADRLKTVVGQAGTGFAEDPFIFHAGQLCQDAPRLLLEIEFGPKPASPSYKYGILG